MSAVDKELAWDLSEILETVAPDLGRSQVEQIATGLTAAGYRKSDDLGSPLVASLSYIESVGAKISKEYLPVFDALANKYLPKEKRDRTDRPQPAREEDPAP